MPVMDKNDAIKLSVKYLLRLKKSKVKFSDAWLFGSYATGKQNKNSDIDLAIILDDSEKKDFNTEVKFMLIRIGEETIIEPHIFTREEFDIENPFINQIVKNGEKLTI